MRIYKKSKFIALVIILMPILNMYKSPFGGSAADLITAMMLLCIFVRYIFDNSRTNIKYKKYIIIFIAYLLFNTIITALYTTSPLDKHMIFSIRYILWYVVILLIVPDVCDFKIAYKVYMWLAVFSTLFLIVQYISMIFFGQYISGVFEEYVNRTDMLNDTQYAGYVQFYRPRSIFEEPAHYGTFVAGILCLVVLMNPDTKKMLLKVFLTFGMLLSGSTTAIALAAFSWGIQLWGLAKRGYVNKKIFILLISLFLAVYIVAQTSSFDVMVTRTFESDSAIESRFGNIENIESASLMEILFGNGSYSNVITKIYGWQPGFILFYKLYGIIGYAAFILMICFLFNKNSGKNTMLYLSFFVILNIGTEAITTSFIFLYLPFIMRGIPKNEYELTLDKCYNSSLQKS